MQEIQHLGILDSRLRGNDENTHSMKNDVLLAFGSNLGDRRRTLKSAWSELETMPDIEAVVISRFYETKPVGGPPKQSDYLNAAGLIRTDLPPMELLKRLQEIERRYGRVRTERWGSRTLDIDLLLYGSAVIETPELTVPHPEMLRRCFVLEPASEIAAEIVHPTAGITIVEALEKLNE